MRIDRPVVEVLIVADDILHEWVSLDHSFCILHEVFEECEFGLGYLYLDPIDRHDMCLGIEVYISEAYSLSIHTVLFPYLRSFQEGMDPRDEFTWWERLRDIVISSEFEERYLIVFALTGREYDDGDSTCSADLTTDFYAIFPREIDIEYDDMWLGILETSERIGPIFAYSYLESCLFEVHRQGSDDAIIVFDEEELIHTYWDREE